jgi:hypothetical protein
MVLHHQLAAHTANRSMTLQKQDSLQLRVIGVFVGYGITACLERQCR